MSVINGNSSELIVKNGLILNLDAGNRKSYISGSNTWYDLSGNNNNGTLTNGPTFSNTTGGSIALDGVDDVISFSTTPLSTALNNITMEVWFNQTSAINNTRIFYNGNSGNSGYGIYVGPCGTGATRIGVLHGGKNCAIVSYSGITTDTWYHLVYVKGASTDNYLYVNGVLVSTGTGDYNTPVSGDTSIGRSIANPVDASNAKIGVARLYNKALSASEVLQNYNANKSRFTTSSLSISNVPRVPTNGLILSLDPSNPKSYVSGSTSIYDLSTSNFTGSLSGSITYSNAALNFNGSNTEINIGNTSSLSNLGEGTVSAWVKAFGGNSGYRGVFTKQLSFGMFLYDDYFASYDWATSKFGITEFLIKDSKWYHLALAFSGSVNSYNNCDFYINGEKKFVFSKGVSNDTVLPQIGNGGTGVNQRFTGSVSYVTAHNRKLSANEINNIYISTKERYRDNLGKITASFTNANPVLDLDAANASSYTNGSTQWYDISGNGYTASLYNNVTYSSANSGSLVFDGINAYGLVSSSPSTVKTVSVWMNNDDTGNRPIILSGDVTQYNSNVWDWSMYMFSNDFYALSSAQPGGSFVKSSASQYVGVWTNITLVRNDGVGNMRIYKNGVLLQTNNSVGSAVTNLSIGRGGNYYKGKISKIQLYDTALTQDDILKLYNTYKGRYGL